VTYVQNVVLAPGDCVADPSTDPRLDGNPRRLQQAMSADYVVVFPAALGLEGALEAVEASRTALDTISLEEVTQILQEEVLAIPSIANIAVSVSTKPTVVLQVTDDNAAGGVFFCTEAQRPSIDGAGDYSCVGAPGKGQKCSAPCAGSDLEAEIVCWSTLEWLVTEHCLSESEGLDPWVVFLIVFMCCLCLLLLIGLVVVYKTGACKKVTPEEEALPPPVKEDAWGPDQKASQASKSTPSSPTAAQASRRANSREEGSRPSSREAPREGSLDPPPPPHEVSMKSRGSNKERPDTPQEPTSTMMYLDDTVGAGAMSPGPTQKETVTFMVDQQEDFRVWVQQDLPQHPLPMQNSTIHPGAVQWD